METEGTDGTDHEKQPIEDTITETGGKMKNPRTV
jgi:hypothetical protein